MSRVSAKIAREVADLEGMTLLELRLDWERRYGAAPGHRSADLLRRVLAWRIQADAYGGFDAATRRMIERAGPIKPGASAGMRLARDWAGKRHEVVVIESGAVYEGVTYRSLSSVAKHITGMNWNGPRFFGLRQENVR